MTFLSFMPKKAKVKHFQVADTQEHTTLLSSLCGDQRAERVLKQVSNVRLHPFLYLPRLLPFMYVIYLSLKTRLKPCTQEDLQGLSLFSVGLGTDI